MSARKAANFLTQKDLLEVVILCHKGIVPFAARALEFAEYLQRRGLNVEIAFVGEAVPSEQNLHAGMVLLRFQPQEATV